jgi:CheY-like chemotaxis protein
MREPGVDLIAVVEDDRPVGLIERGPFLSRLFSEGAMLEPINGLMITQPLIVSQDADPSAVCDRLLSGSHAASGCILVDRAGLFVGLVAVTALLKALRLDHLAKDPNPVPSPTEASQKAARAERDQFVSAVARQIAGPLEGIVGIAELLARQPLSTDGRTHVNTILETGRSVRQLLLDSAELGRLDAGEFEICPEPVALRELMDDLEASWRSRAQAAGLTLLVSYEGAPDLSVSVDARQLRRVFTSLVERAIGATQRGAVEASLKARVEPAGVHLEGSIRDSGPDLPAHRLARIFEPMSASADGGMVESVGLALSNRIITAMHGSIRAESNVGAGSSITFHILAAQVDAVSQPSEQDHDAPPAAGRRAHVLVVDDNATNRMVAEALCEMFDCTSECVEDGVEAVELAASGRFDLILMDIKMPRMDGVAATRAIRSFPGHIGRVPIIALTANADPDDARRYVMAGMYAVVEKPIKPDRLLTAMTGALAHALETDFGTEPSLISAA